MVNRVVDELVLPSVTVLAEPYDDQPIEGRNPLVDEASRLQLELQTVSGWPVRLQVSRLCDAPGNGFVLWTTQIDPVTSVAACGPDTLKSLEGRLVPIGVWERGAYARLLEPFRCPCVIPETFRLFWREAGPLPTAAILRREIADALQLEKEERRNEPEGYECVLYRAVDLAELVWRCLQCTLPAPGR